MYYDEERIQEIARQAARSRGHMEYGDFDDYMRELICQGKLEPTKAGWSLFQIKDILISKCGYTFKARPARFYPR